MIHAMETPYTGEGEVTGGQRRLLLALLVGPVEAADVTAWGLMDAALELRTGNLAECILNREWQLTQDGASLAKRIRAG